MKSSPKIAYLLTPITFGGAEKVSLNFLAHVDRNRFDIHPILLTRPWEDEPYLVKKIKEYGYSYDLVPVALRDSRDPFRVARVFKKIHSILKKSPFDLVHTNGYFADICALPASRMLGVPGISTCHGFINNDARLRFYNRLDLNALRLTRRIFCVSKEIKDLLIKSRLPAEKLRVLPNAVPVCDGQKIQVDIREMVRRSLNIARDEFLIGYCGRLSEEKGLSFLVKAQSELARAGIQTKLILIGDGPKRKELEKMAQDLGTDNLVIFIGFRQEVADLLQSLDAFVLPSLTEGTPMALLEAMAAGIPVIASAVGEIPSIIENNVNGILVGPAKSNEIAHALGRLIGDNSLRLQFSQEALDTVKNRFNLKPWIEALEKNYLEVLNSH
jgi:glycosyltransferase involved in cell wall biosynthesis